MARPAHQNPFRTSRLHALRFRYPEGDTEDALLRRLEAHGGRGAIVGPHGSGKTTLCLELAARFRAEGLDVRMLRYGEGTSLCRPHSLRAWIAGAGARSALIVDGAGHLGPLAWWNLLRRSKRAARVLVTAHGRCPFPAILRTTTSTSLFDELCTSLGQPMPGGDSAALLAAHRGDVRAALRTLYDAWAEARP
ncbi:MAG: hypothetical protein ACO3UM_08205 [Planctomycetota bacterium]